MSTSLLPPGQWAQSEFGFAQLGDQRRNQRLVNITEHLAARPGGTLPQAFPDWAELKAAYRFFGQRGVSFERVLAPYLERTRQACRNPANICSSKTPRCWITSAIGTPQSWAASATGADGDWYMGRDPSDRGNVVRYNYFHHCGNVEQMNRGIYSDDSTTGVLVRGNIFYRMNAAYGVLFSNSGCDLIMTNNIVIEPCSHTVVMSAHYYSSEASGH